MGHGAQHIGWWVLPPLRSTWYQFEYLCCLHLPVAIAWCGLGAWGLLPSVPGRCLPATSHHSDDVTDLARATRNRLVLTLCGAPDPLSLSAPVASTPLVRASGLPKTDPGLPITGPLHMRGQLASRTGETPGTIGVYWLCTSYLSDTLWRGASVHDHKGFRGAR